jgi:hypothetical protein
MLDTHKVLASNPFRKRPLASPTVVENDLLIRAEEVRCRIGD